MLIITLGDGPIGPSAGPVDQLTTESTNPRARTKPMRHDRADQSRACSDPMRLSHFPLLLSHFTISSSTFSYNELIHFARVNSTILLDTLKIFAESFCYSELNYYSTQSFSVATVPCPFLVATVLSHFYCCSAQRFLVDTVLSHFLIDTMLNHFFDCYSAQPFHFNTVLSHSSLIQFLAIPH
jgi:hypothetical protein